jgi:hypothetical protein
MAKDQLSSQLAEYEAKLAEFDARADKLGLAERALVQESREDETLWRDLVARYDAALEAKDEAGIAAYQAGYEELRNKHIARKAALAAVRAEYDALERRRPRRPRRTWGELLGVRSLMQGAALGKRTMGVFKEAWSRYRRAKQCQRELTKAFAEQGVDFMSVDSKTHEIVLKEAMVTDISTVVVKWVPIFEAFSAYNQKVNLSNRQMNNLGKPPSEWDAPHPLETLKK